MGYAIIYVLALVISKCVSSAINNKNHCIFINDIFNQGHKINKSIYDEIMNKYKSREKVGILDFIPGICVIKSVISYNNILKKIKNDPAFVSNLVKIDLVDAMFIRSTFSHLQDSRDLSLHELIERAFAILVLFDKTEAANGFTDFGDSEEKELNINEDGSLSKDVVDKMVYANKTFEQTASKKNFYMLPDTYTLSEVYRIDESPIFVSNPNGTNIAFINATSEEVNEFSKKGYIVKPNINSVYHIISFQPFDKVKLRKSLLEIEYFKNPIDQIIDGDTLEDNKKEKKRTL